MAKLDELGDMGLPAFWIRIAHLIGYDNFLIFWKALDAAAEHREVARSDNQSMIEVQLRRYSSFERYQRNRLIETLEATGLTPAAIRLAIKQQLGENLSLRHIRRLSNRGRIVR